MREMGRDGRVVDEAEGRRSHVEHHVKQKKIAAPETRATGAPHGSARGVEGVIRAASPLLRIRRTNLGADYKARRLGIRVEWLLMREIAQTDEARHGTSDRVGPLAF